MAYICETSHNTPAALFPDATLFPALDPRLRVCFAVVMSVAAVDYLPCYRRDDAISGLVGELLAGENIRPSR